MIQSRKGPILISTRGVLGPHDSATMSGPFLMRSQGQKALAGLMSQLHPPLSAGAEHEVRLTHWATPPWCHLVASRCGGARAAKRKD